MNFIELQDFYNIIFQNNKTKLYYPKKIRDFWNNNKDFWFSHTPLDKWGFYQKKYKNNINHQIKLLLYYDQLIRHNELYNKYNFIYLKFSTYMALNLIHNKYFYKLTTIEKIFTLLALRHNNSLKLKYLCLKKLYELRKEIDNNLFIRFLKNTILDINNLKISLTLKPIHNDINTENTENIYNNNIHNNIHNNANAFSNDYLNKNILTEIQSLYLDIIDNSYTDNINKINLNKSDIIEKNMINTTNNLINSQTINSIKLDKIAVSISGGVDSMLCSYLIKRYTKKELILLHICYNNRDESMREILFLKKWAEYLNCKLYVRLINEIKRENNSKFREMYEYVTKHIRFSFYEYFNCPVILGHNKDDCYENIFSNLSKQIHFDNLLGMEKQTKEGNITILRPFIDYTKQEILNIALKNKIPFLKDSTPEWSRRGKMRDILIPQIKHFDSKILNGLHNLSKYMYQITKQLDNYLYNWINNNIILRENNILIKKDDFFYNNYKNITFWVKIWFYLDLEKRPSNKSFHNLINNINSDKIINCDLNKEYKAYINKEIITIKKL
jgi:tRNA(Ile)-lysidine synthetase-like protein